MKIVKNANLIELSYKDILVEVYKMDEAIDFKLLVEFLLKDEFTTNFVLEDLVDSPANAEIDLISLIKDIVEKYNLKKIEFDKFLSSK